MRTTKTWSQGCVESVQTEVNDKWVWNILKKHKNLYYKLTPVGVLFPPSITNDAKQIFVTYWELNNVKIAVINGKINNILEIINSNKINNWDYIKGTSLWVNANFNEPKQINNSEHLSFSFETFSLNNQLDFSITLIDESNKPLEFNSRETKTSILIFKIEVSLKWTEN